MKEKSETTEVQKCAEYIRKGAKQPRNARVGRGLLRRRRAAEVAVVPGPGGAEGHDLLDVRHRQIHRQRRPGPARHTLPTRPPGLPKHAPTPAQSAELLGLAARLRREAYLLAHDDFELRLEDFAR